MARCSRTKRTPWLLGLIALVVIGLGSHGACSSSAPSLSEHEASAIVHIDVDDAPTCLGSAVAPEWVLTARHCVTDDAYRPLEAGRLRIRHGNRALVAQAVHLQPLDQHHKHNALADLAGEDIALLHVPDLMAANTLALADEVAPTAFAVVSGQLQPAPVRAVEAAQVFTEGVTCPGDSGGPLFDASHHLIGIASWRTPGACGTGTSVFTRVSAHHAWIAMTLRP